MTYARFLEEAYQAIRAEAPAIWQLDAMPRWMRSIGELLLHLPSDLQREWAEQYATLLVVKYGYLKSEIARICVRQGLTEAAARWPKTLERVR